MSQPTDSVNLFGLSRYDNQSSFFGDGHPLGEGLGYGVVAGFGVFFGVLTTLLVWSYSHFGGVKYDSEQFNTAGRSLKGGLLACDTVAHWCWPSTLLQSSVYVYQSGISGGYWYASGSVWPMVCFGFVAAEIKRKAPNAHTVLEIVKVRWGTVSHFVFMYFCLLTNVLITAQIILATSQVINSLTGINIVAACILTPSGILLYTTTGGLVATFLSSYLHTIVVYVVLIVMASRVYLSGGGPLGSLDLVYEHLTYLATVQPLSGNKDGSYLTMFSLTGLWFGLVTRPFGQSAIASKPSAGYRGFLWGVIMWMAVPLTLATSLGLAAHALDLPFSDDEVNEGLVPAGVALVIWGKAGAILYVVILIMAVTSAGAAEMVAVSTILSYDVYRTYIRRRAKGPEMLLVSRISMVIFGAVIAGVSICFNYVGISLNYTLLI
ncbi:hypothetical protein WJX73_004522 [Symbiochloris irregularis]|uniref:Urea active transporter 1 n=1 Tax=Symbiochloris irregularis TaxID=706552 RepID=A0AAW1PRS2_9CHLO